MKSVIIAVKPMIANIVPLTANVKIDVKIAVIATDAYMSDIIKKK